MTKPVSVIYDHQAFAMQRFGGVSRYFVELYRHFRDFDVDPIVPGFVHQNAILEEASLDFKSRAKFVSYRASRLRYINLVNHLLLSAQSQFQNAQVYHPTYYNLNPVLARRPTVVTVYDMIHEVFPNMFGSTDNTAKRKKAAVERADHILCISQSTKNDLVDILNVAPEKATVVPLAVNEFWSKTDSKSNLSCHQDYILFVGSRGGYKNFSQLIDAFGSNKWLSDNLRIICFGGGAFTDSELQHLRNTNLRSDQVAQVDGTDSELRSLYEGAIALSYPTKYEGFGLPVLEAMSVGCPVITTNSSSLPEVAGNAAELVDANDVEMLASRIESLAQSTRLRQEMIARGLEQAKLFSWRKTAELTSKVYFSLV